MLKLPEKDISFVKSHFINLYGSCEEKQFNRYQDAFFRFKNYYNVDCVYVASSSGRVEICGNHTDHNGGRVVTCAISLDTLAMFLPAEDNIISIKSDGYDEILVDTNGEENEKKGTPESLVRGVVVALRNKGYAVGGFKALFTSNVLGGAGISSSASFEVLVAEILNFLYNNGKISNEEKAVASQFAEREYFGKPCGLLDQAAIAFGGLNKFDFSIANKIGVERIDNCLSDYTLVLVNTGGSHANLTHEYASIPKEMKEVANCFDKDRLIEIDYEDFYSKIPAIYNKLSGRALSRAIHFFEENKRVDSIADALIKEDYLTFLDCINQSGKSSLCLLQNCYTTGDLEQSIPKALAVAENYLRGGAIRIHGGGFAGCILNVIKNEHLNDFIYDVSKIFGGDNIIPLKVRSVGAIVL